MKRYEKEIYCMKSMQKYQKVLNMYEMMHDMMKSIKNGNKERKDK